MYLVPVHQEPLVGLDGFSGSGIEKHAENFELGGGRRLVLHVGEDLVEVAGMNPFRAYRSWLRSELA